MELPEFHEGLAPVQGQRGVGYIDAKGAFAIPPRFQPRAGDFHEGIASIYVQPAPANVLAIARIDHSGKVAFRKDYQNAHPPNSYGPIRTDFSFSEGMLRLSDGNLWGFVDRTFQWVIRPEYSMVSDFHEGPANAHEGRAAEMFIDKTGKEVISLAGRSARGDFNGGLVAVASAAGHPAGLIDRIGQEVVPLKYRMAWSLGEGYGAVATDEGAALDGAALFDSHGKQLTQFKFGWFASSFSGGLLAAGAAGGQGIGYVDVTGAFVIPQQFEQALNFSGALARVLLKSGDFGYVNRKGKVVWSGGHVAACPAT